MDKLIEDLNLSKLDDGDDLIKISLSPEHCCIPLNQPIDEFYYINENLNNNLGDFYNNNGKLFSFLLIDNKNIKNTLHK